jgi:putative nucleotidyltransferase with HDIG domain
MLGDSFIDKLGLFREYDELLFSVDEKDDLYKMLEYFREYDENSYLHGLRVGYIAGFIGFYDDLDNEEILDLFWGGLLHDIGKLYVPIDIIRKNKPLSVTEREIINKHSEYGGILLKQFGVNDNIVNIVRNHHLRESDNLFYYIVSIVDITDALLSSRSYKDSFNDDEALEILSESFDSDIAKKVISIYESLF